jgi:hypothetical protein
MEERDHPLVSLVMPVWRPRPEWLFQAVGSALGQRDCRLELIVVDDGCEESLATLLQDVHDDRLRIVRVEHGGVSRARNAGIAACRGTRLRFVDCDDVLDLDSTAHLLRLMGDGDNLITYGATLVCDAALQPQSRMASRVAGPAVRACLLNRFTVMLPAMLFPRGVVERAGEWDPAMTVCEDWDFVLRSLDHASVRGDDSPAFFYRRHGDSASNRVESPLIREQGISTVISKYFERHPEARGTRLETQIQATLDILASDRTTRGRPWRSNQFWKAGLHCPGMAVSLLRRRLHLVRRVRDLSMRMARSVSAPARWCRRTLRSWR